MSTLTAEPPTYTCWDCKAVCEPLVSDVDGSVAYVCPAHGCIAEGTYIGVALDEEDLVPYHYFVYGEIRNTAQRCFGFPAAANTPVTTSLTPTVLINTWLAKRGEIA